jgi:hypothetical protein
MDNLSSQLSEYKTVMSMYGVEPVLCSQLIAEIGDISRINSSKSLVALPVLTLHRTNLESLM